MRMTAKITGFDELIDEFNAIGDKAVPAAKAAVYAGAGVVADLAKQNLRKSLSGKSTGDLENSLGITPIGEVNGIINARVGFDGYDRNGTPNPLKANVLESGRKLESGTSSQPARPFMRPAVNAAKKVVPKVMAETFREEIEKIQKG